MPEEVKILVVDDIQFVRHDIVNELRKIEYKEVYELETGEEVLPFLNKQKIDVILMDIDLGDGMNGIETTKLINQHFEIPILFFTSLEGEEIYKKAWNASRPEYFEFIQKPVRAYEISVKIHAALAKLALFQKQKNESKPTVFNIFKKKEPEIGEKENFIINDFIYVPVSFKKIKVPFSDIVSIEYANKWCLIRTKTRELPVRRTLGDLYKELDKNIFHQVNRSQVVNLKLINEMNHNGEKLIMTNNSEVVVTRQRKKELKSKMASL